MRMLFSIILFLMAGAFPCWSQTSTKPDKPDWHFEIGSSLTNVNGNYGRWHSGDAKITYTGSKYFSPSLSAGSQTRPEGSQQAYGIGSYINFGKNAYAIVGTGIAPNRGTILYPSFRYDLLGVFRVQPVKGLLMTTGYSSYRMGGGSAKVTSIGGIYYSKVILEGGIAFNRSYPGGLPSKSGHLSFMRGRQGKYYFGAGASGGNIHYQLLGVIPYDARFNAYGFSAFFQKWLGSNWGITQRYYFTNVIDGYISNSVGISLFYDF
jgi:YaiO family outer membrane protein